MNHDYIDTTVNPGDDFFKYATGNWINLHPQLPEYPRWDIWANLDNENNEKINTLIKNPGNSEIGRKIKIYKNIFSNWKKRNEDGIIPLKQFLYKNVYSLFTREEIIEFCAKEHFPLFFSLNLSIDLKNSNYYALYVSQSGLLLGNKDYYLNKTEANKKILKAYKKYIISLYKLFGKTEDVAKEKFKTLLKIEKQIAKVSYSEEELQNPELNYHKKNIEKLSKSVKFDFNKFLCLYGFDASRDVIVGQEKQFKLACKLFNTLDIEDLKTILEIHIISAYINLFDDKSRKIKFTFSKAFSGATIDMPKKKRVINAINGLFSEAIGQLYVEKYFSKEAKEDVKEIVDNLIISFKNILSEHDWLSENTKKLAFEKLNKMRIKIGYPDIVDDYSAMPIDETLTLFENRRNISKYFFEKNKEKYYNKPVNKDEWFFPPQTINAYYSPTLNEICFPAGILQGDFYQYGRDIAKNYGGIGVVIGHEMTHGFDNHGRQFDASGNMVSWWAPEEIEKFNKLTENTVNHFNELDVLPDLKANGTLTLGENLADYGGVKIAYNALKVKTDDIKDLKDFFISFATVWAGINTEEGLRTQTITNEHSTNFNRVNGTLAMFTPWYEVFEITPKDKMFIPISKRAKIW